jgi:hypothetical protein
MSFSFNNALSSLLITIALDAFALKLHPNDLTMYVEARYNPRE